MTRSLRKRHLIMWLLITGLLATLLITARLNVPVFEGEQIKITTKP